MSTDSILPPSPSEAPSDRLPWVQGLLGMLLGAAPGNERALPASHRWMVGLNVLPKVQALMDRLAEQASGEGEGLEAGAASRGEL